MKLFVMTTLQTNKTHCSQIYSDPFGPCIIYITKVNTINLNDILHEDTVIVSFFVNDRKRFLYTETAHDSPRIATQPQMGTWFWSKMYNMTTVPCPLLGLGEILYIYQPTSNGCTGSAPVRT